MSKKISTLILKIKLKLIIREQKLKTNLKINLRFHIVETPWPQIETTKIHVYVSSLENGPQPHEQKKLNFLLLCHKIRVKTISRLPTRARRGPHSPSRRGKGQIVSTS